MQFRAGKGPGMSRTISRMSQVDMLRYKPGDLTPRPMESSSLTQCRRSTANCLTSHKMTLLNLFLILIDILAVVGEITLAYVCECPILEAPSGSSGGHARVLQAPESSKPMSARERGLRGIAAAVAPALAPVMAFARSLSSHGGGHAGGNITFDLSDFNSYHSKLVDQEHLVHNVETGLFSISISILCLLLLQQFALMYALGFKYFTKTAYVVDFIVITTAMLLELFVSATSGGFVIVLAVWRAVRLLHGIFVAMEAEQAEHHAGMDKAHKIHEQLVRRSSYHYTVLQYNRHRALGRKITRWVNAVYQPRAFRRAAQAKRKVRQLPLLPERQRWPAMRPNGHLR